MRRAEAADEEMAGLVGVARRLALGQRSVEASRGGTPGILRRARFVSCLRSSDKRSAGPCAFAVPYEHGMNVPPMHGGTPWSTVGVFQKDVCFAPFHMHRLG
jgi:hypothetical protein